MNYLNKDGLTYLWGKIKEKLELKQDKLIAGTNITIKGNVISSNGSTAEGTQEVYIGTEEPGSDNDAVLWLNPDGESVSIVTYDQMVDYVNTQLGVIENGTY